MKANPLSPRRAALEVALLAGLAACCVVACDAAAAGCRPEALGTSRVLAVGTEGGAAFGLKTYPRTLALADREIVLTFDDGPLAPTTGRILQALARECVKATFFLVGRNAEARPELVRRALAEGHTIATHSYSHPARSLAGLGQEAAQREIERGIAAVERAAYGAAHDGARLKFFRFPGFDDTPALLRWLSAQNIAVFGTDLWASDWIPMTPEAELALLMGRIEKAGRGIVLLHDIKRQTAAMLPSFLDELKKRGYKIVHLVQGTGVAEAVPAPPGWRPVTGYRVPARAPRAMPSQPRSSAPVLSRE